MTQPSHNWNKGGTCTECGCSYAGFERRDPCPVKSPAPAERRAVRMLKVRRVLYWRWPLPKVNLHKAIKLPPCCGAYADDKGRGRDKKDICSQVPGLRRSNEKLVLGRHSRKFGLPKFLYLAFNQAPKKFPLLGLSFSEQNLAEAFDVLSCDPGVHKAARFLSRSKRRSSGLPSRSSFNLPLKRRSPAGQVKRIYITSGYPSPVQREGSE